MSDFTTIHWAEAYLNIHLTHAGPAGAPPPIGPFITISRESGTGGSSFAQALLARLSPPDTDYPWAVYSGNLIEEMLRTNNLPEHLARFLPEDRIREFDASVGELVGLHPNLWDLVAKTNDLIRHVARVGRAILLGRGANFATAGIAHGFHVRLVAPVAFRAANTARRRVLTRDAAATHNAVRDAARRRYVRATFGADIADLTAYTLVLNAERLSLDTMVEMVAHLVDYTPGRRAREGVSAAGVSTLVEAGTPSG
jgi:cytidylate kinase